jgi:protein-L-isoaspartate O-methyltransferase
MSAGPRSGIVANNVLASFLSLVSSRPAAEIVDLGPAIGSNIAYLGERLDCRIHVKDLYADLERHAREDALDRFPQFIGGRFAEYDRESIDAVLCWDLFDYLVPTAAIALAGTLMRALRPRGALLAVFGAGVPGESSYTRYVIDGEGHFHHRVSAASCGRQQILQNRDILALFPDLDLFNSVLLKSGVREVLFCKPVGRNC